MFACHRGPGMSLAACASLVERGDPDRFLACMAAPAAARAQLWPLYAFNLEVARAPLASAEPLIAEMRLQWWRDAVEAICAGGVVPAHETAGPLAEVIGRAGLPGPVLMQMVDARRWDIGRSGFADFAALAAYLDATAAGLMWLAARALGAGAQAEQTVRALGWASGLANWLRAVPELEARGRVPLADRRPAAVAALAAAGLQRLDDARQSRGLVPASAGPALLAGWQAGAILRQAVQEPERVFQAGGLGQSEFARRGGLLWRSVTGRW